MRFEVRYPTGAQHEVELSGTLAVLGRDPSSDLTLNDPKCSRRHAVIEAGPDGMAIRDAGSANGVYVNGKKVERARLVDGDEVRLGDVVIRVLPEDVPGTLVMAPEDLDEMGATHPPRAAQPPAPRPQPPPPAPKAAPPRAQPVPPKAPSRPSVPPSPPPGVDVGAPTQGTAPGTAKGGTNQTLLIVGALGCLALLLLVLLGILAAIFLPAYLRGRAGSASATAAACAARLRAVAAAEEAFRAGTCGAYADLEGLTKPASVIPLYPASGPAFLSPALSTPEADGCRFDLTVEDPVPAAPGCPSRAFRRYRYTSAPVSGQGQYLMIESNGSIHVADSRSATGDDPLLTP